MLTDSHNALPCLTTTQIVPIRPGAPINFQGPSQKSNQSAGALEMARFLEINFKGHLKCLKFHQKLYWQMITIWTLSSRSYHETAGRWGWKWIRYCSRFCKLFTRKLLLHLRPRKPTCIASPGFPGSCCAHMIELYGECKQKWCVPFLSQGLREAGLPSPWALCPSDTLRWRWQESHRHSSRATKWKLSGSLNHHGRKAAHGPGRPTFDCYVNKKQICIVFKPCTFWGSICKADNPTPQRVAWPSQEAGVYAASCVMKWFMEQMAQAEPQRNSTAHLPTQSKGLPPAVPASWAQYPSVQGYYHTAHGEVRSEE